MSFINFTKAFHQIRLADILLLTNWNKSKSIMLCVISMIA